MDTLLASPKALKLFSRKRIFEARKTWCSEYNFRLFYWTNL